MLLLQLCQQIFLRGYKYELLGGSTINFYTHKCNQSKSYILCVIVTSLIIDNGAGISTSILLLNILLFIVVQLRFNAKGLF